MLNREYGCKLELGGDDQWSNILGGLELCRKKDGKQVYGMTFTPVSYTHLDVYKRQELYETRVPYPVKRSYRFQKRDPDGYKGNGYSKQDVYKRQVYSEQVELKIPV